MTAKPLKVSNRQFIWIALLSLAVFASNLFLFYIQSIELSLSDFPTHIVFSLEGDSNYSLLHILVKLLHGVWSNTVLMSTLLALMSVAAVWAGWALLRYLAPDASPLLLFFAAFACTMEISLYIPALGPMYLGSYGAGVWHNPTYTLLKPLAALALLYYLKICKTYLDKFPWTHYAIFTVVLTLSTWVKPSFFVSFAPAMAVLLLRDFITRRGKGFGRMVILGLSVAPSLLIIVMQSLILFDDANAVSIGWLTVLGHYTQYPVLSLLKSIAFPAVALAVCGRALKNNTAAWAAVLNTLFAVTYAFLLYETGRRLAEGNFMWGAFIAVFLLFLVATAALFQWQAKNKIIRSGSMAQKTGFWVMAALLAAHMVFGIIYYAGIFAYGTYLY
ncbi:hypothetical protein LJC04_01420 [Ruminococcaceae bacterium OttesenSCG-928-O06]|nr:hypothetical protein [Ruminococcaceae bacterium OttesenSCG-928-O06]